MAHLYLTQYEWHTDREPNGWYPPGGGVHLDTLDLRSLPQMAAAGGAPQGFGLFSYAAPQAGLTLALGQDIERQLTLVERSGIRTLLGTTALSETRLDRIIRELFLTKGDPTGQTAFKPCRSRPHIAIGGWGTLFQEPLNARGIANTVAVFRADYTRMRLAGTPVASLRRFTGNTMLKCFRRMGDDLIVGVLPAEFQGDGWAVPATIATDDFNRADGELGANWNDDGGDADILTNQCRVTTGTLYTRWLGSDMSSDDHYCKAAIISTSPGNWLGPIARKVDTTTITFYASLKQTGSTGVVQRFKCVAGSFTQIGSNTADTIASGDVYEIRMTSADECQYWKGGVQQASTSPETSITGNLTGGLAANTTAIDFDDWELADIEAAGVVGPLIGGRLVKHGILQGRLVGVR